MRPEAKFADGTPITSADVVFTFRDAQDEGPPQYRGAAARRRDGGGARCAHRALRLHRRADRDLPLVVAGAADPVQGLLRDARVRSDHAGAAAGLGPLRDRRIQSGSFVGYRRREDYWAKDLPVNRGRFNFDEVRYEYYRDRAAELLSASGRRVRSARGVHGASTG